MEEKRLINIGIGFVTGRKSFRNVINTYVDNWNESGLVDDIGIRLNLFVNYDLKYTGTRISDYKKIDNEKCNMVDSTCFISRSDIHKEMYYLTRMGVITSKEAKLIFGDGYAKRRNAVLYFALKNHMDYLFFLDDDEYPLVPCKANGGLLWKGQHVLASHIKHIKNADITHGYHCGYISPIPYVEFNDVLSEEVFRVFIENISNDIVSWDSIKNKMNEGGVTYADEEIIRNGKAVEVKEALGMKFISGSNLCINLKNSNRVFPFYNPPGARGEDTFLSTCLSSSRVVKVPCYTFHDGFSTYEHLLNGVLPNTLKPVKADSDQVINRFLTAAVGWIRYKPLLLYITQREIYNSEIERMKENLSIVLPIICSYFKNQDFIQILKELEHYHKNVQKHFKMFVETKLAWQRVVDFIKN